MPAVNLTNTHLHGFLISVVKIKSVTLLNNMYTKPLLFPPSARGEDCLHSLGIFFCSSFWYSIAVVNPLLLQAVTWTCQHVTSSTTQPATENLASFWIVSRISITTELRHLSPSVLSFLSFYIYFTFIHEIFIHYPEFIRHLWSALFHERSWGCRLVLVEAGHIPVKNKVLNCILGTCNFHYLNLNLESIFIDI